MTATVKNLVIEQGATFSQTLFWETIPFFYKPITAVSKAAPVSITCPAHGLPSGWRVAVVSVLGMTQLNAANQPPKDKDFHEVTVVDANTVTLNTVNSARYNAYASGGYLQFYTPVDLTGYSARLIVKTKIDGELLLALDSTAGTAGSIVISNDNKTITLLIPAVVTAAFTWKKGVYDLEMVSPTGVVTRLLSGAITMTPEVSA